MFTKRFSWPLFLGIVFLLSNVHPASAQLSVVQGSSLGMTPAQLVQNHLIGAGITVSNVTYNGTSTTITSNQIGTYVAAGVAGIQLGLNGGVIMTSGQASLAIGPNNKTSAGANAGGTGDPDLNIISANATFDKAVIEFDFVPQYDTVKFRYVFGSEEFFEFCNQYNDAFGFFLSGPGINGTFSNNSVNIALMPGGSASNYVTINNICANTNTRWDNTGGQYFQYDGMSRVFNAWHLVTPCSTYHIKLAIADAVDHSYDSGVFLEENSFSSMGVTMNNIGAIPDLGPKAVEGCNDVSVKFKLSAVPTYPYVVHYTIHGSAQNGVDYTAIPDSVVITPGHDSVLLVIHPKLDLIPEGTETVILTLNQISCSGTVTADTIKIYDYLPMSILPERDTTVCHGANVRLEADVMNGIRPYTYAWNPSGADSVLNIIPPVGVNNYILNVRDMCNNHVFDTTVVTVHPTPIADAGTDLVIPNGTSTTLHGSASAGYGNYSYAWNSNPPGFTSALQNPNTGNLTLTTIFTLEATDLQSSCISDPDNVIIAVQGGPLSANPVADPDTVCFGTPTHLYSLAGGGSGLYSYTWSSNPPGLSSTLPDFTVIPDQNTVYHVTVNDGFNQMNGTTTVVVNPLPVIHLGPQDSIVCIYSTVVLDAGNPGSSYYWSNGADTRTITVAASGIGFEIQPYKVYVTNSNNCLDSAMINVMFSFSACVGIGEKNGRDEFMVYPNPSEGRFRVSLKAKGSQLKAEMLDLVGTKVWSEEWNGLSGMVERDIDVSFLPRGMYILRLNGDNFHGTRKLVLR